jgi:hypothetical protein
MKGRMYKTQHGKRIYKYRENKEFVMLFEISTEDDDDDNDYDDSNCNRYCKINLKRQKTQYSYFAMAHLPLLGPVKNSATLL